ncbi:small, acid-soluble spore protein K [Bacillaceae bacterium SIJ1]|nr:small, acid-soluble spore protein K [Litoribacterium kuwaitense]NGP46570.1 small, acid-soluble spore protein K [Litoribacterium kuwaitense]
MRNKAKDFPPRMSLDGEPRAKAVFASKRANGTIQTEPQKRMEASGKRSE